VTDPDPGRYRLQVAGPAARALAGRLPEKVAAAVYEFITTALVENSHRAARIASSTRSTRTTSS
jgi:mRNA interferase RelE/StbE